MSEISREFNELADSTKRLEVNGEKLSSKPLSDETVALLMIAKRLDKIVDNLESISRTTEKIDGCIKTVHPEKNGKKYNYLLIGGSVV